MTSKCNKFENMQHNFDSLTHKVRCYTLHHQQRFATPSKAGMYSLLTGDKSISKTDIQRALYMRVLVAPPRWASRILQYYLAKNKVRFLP